MLELQLSHVIIAAVAVVVLIGVAALIAWKTAINYHIKVSEAKVGSAEEKAREIIDDALKTAETKKREALLEAKEENMKAKNDLDKETKERRAELQRYERRVLTKEETLDKKTEAIERREASFRFNPNSWFVFVLLLPSFCGSVYACKYSRYSSISVGRSFSKSSNVISRITF